MGPFGPRKFLVFQKIFVIRQQTGSKKNKQPDRQTDKHIGRQTYRKLCMDSGMLLSFITHFTNLLNTLKHIKPIT